jgi:fucose 4-O-acetylase-like acetyltransferase
MNKESPRIEWIDVARGLVIIPIVIGHSGHEVSGIEELALVRVPFFFFISGILMKPRVPIDIIKRRGLGLMIPFFSTLVVVMIMTLYSFLRHHFSGGLTIELKEMYEAAFVDYALGRVTESFIGAIWFLPALFYVSLITGFLFYRTSTKIKLLFLTGFLAFQFWQSVFQVHYLDYFVLSEIHKGLFYFALGHFLSSEKINFKESLVVLLPIGMVVMFVFSENIILAELSRVMVIIGSFVIIIWISKILCFIHLTKRTLIFVGKRTLVILCFHKFFLHFVFSVNAFVDTTGAIVLCLLLGGGISFSPFLSFLFLGKPWGGFVLIRPGFGLHRSKAISPPESVG